MKASGVFCVCGEDVFGRGRRLDDQKPHRSICAFPNGGRGTAPAVDEVYTYKATGRRGADPYRGLLRHLGFPLGGSCHRR